jgi:hypothetical protein
MPLQITSPDNQPCPRTGTRTIFVTNTGSGVYDWNEVKKRIGDTYTLVLWHAPDVEMGSLHVEVRGCAPNTRQDGHVKATVVDIPVVTDGGPVSVTLTWQYSP